MITTEKFSLNVVGEDSGRAYTGDFTIKSSITRQERFRADQVRRDILGPLPEGQMPLPALQTEAYILGQLAVRVTEAPGWWFDGGTVGGLKIEDDYNVILAVYDEILKIDEKKNQKLKKDSEEALKKLTEKA